MMGTLKQKLWAGVMSAAVLVGAPAAAQDAGGLDEVIVTAQKRSENLQEVPISIATIDGEEVATLLSGVEDVLGLANRIPGLNVESSNGRISPRFYIRGLGNIDFDTAASQPVSVITDDVVLENVILKSFPIFDTAQVEVLRGPQGTLFGRNTPAGIVKFDSRKPTEEAEGFINFNIGSLGTINSQAAIGGPIVDGVLSGRISGLLQRQSDWVSNDFTGEEDALGGFRELAGRAQLLYTPTDTFSALLNLQYADLTGNSASIFRANIVGPGNNNLNANFDRDRVTFDGGDNNPSARDIFLGSLKIEADLSDTVSFTSITAYSDLNRTSRGDIDGGAIDFSQNPPVSTPGFIPFPSDTGGTSESDQFTQEIRFASQGGGALNWQVGAFYFRNSLEDVTDANVTFLGITPSTNLTEQQSWAIFGQAGYDITDQFSIAGGLRYTDDEKDFRVLVPPTAGFTLANGTLQTDVQDDEISWDISGTYQATDDINLYARVARGFRGPSIQGRNVAFAGGVSTAQSETVLSYEVGFKSILFDNRLRLNAAAYTYDVDDIQLTAVGGGSNSIILLNADNANAIGFEADLEFAPNDNLDFTAGISYTDTEIQDDGLAVGVCAQCTVTDPLDAAGFALIDGNPLPQAPEITLNATLRYGIPVGDGELYFYTDWFVQGDTNIFLYESVEFNSSGNFEGGLRIGYIFGEDGEYEVAGFARNITNEENLIGAIDFNNNTGFVNQPRIIGASLKASF